MAELLDCGHPVSPHSDITTGWGSDDEGKRYCYDCCLERDKERMRETGKLFAYLREDGAAVTIWPGNVISDRVRLTTKMRDNFGGERQYLRFVFEGDIWSGFSMGPGWYLRAKRTKLGGLYA